jgi:SAM-dependent methyltransferase
MNPFQHWRDALALWAIPAEILAQAPESPWIHPVELFDIAALDRIPDSPSHAAARAGLGTSLLDVGCGGGKAAFACVPPARHVIGVDHQAAMLEKFTQAAQRRGITSEAYLGDWPAIAEAVPAADVVTCHHVFYNVPELDPFVRALSSHARSRVVVELPMQHPQADNSVWWEHFWSIERPTTPTALDAAECVRALGHDVHVEQHEVTPASTIDEDLSVRFMRIRLCLPASRDAEVRAFMHSLPARPRTNVTLWWDVQPLAQDSGMAASAA